MRPAPGARGRRPVRGGRVADGGGEIDVLVNCAGFAARASTVDTDEAAFDGLFQINVKAPFFLVAALAPKIAARGGGSIINVSTMVASYGQPGAAAYGASRAAIELLTKAWAAEFGPQNVRVNAVAPGPTLTPCFYLGAKHSNANRRRKDRVDHRRQRRDRQGHSPATGITARNRSHLPGVPQPRPGGNGKGRSRGENRP